MGRVFIIGVGQTRFGAHPGFSAEALGEQAVNLALLDAGLSRTDAEASTSPLHEGWSAVRGGAHVALVVACGRAHAPIGPLGAAPDLPAAYPWRAELEAARQEVERVRMAPRHLALTASKNRYHGSLNPRACCRESLTPEQVLADEPVAPPFTRAMCARPSDGAAAVVLCSGALLARLGSAAPVELVASARAPATLEGETAALLEGYGKAGFGPEDVDLAEVHDLTSYAELRLLEASGLCPPRSAGVLVEAGETALGGRIPVNTSGGLVAQGFSGAASALAQIHELVAQLRGRAGQRQVPGARTALAVAGGKDGGTGETSVCVLGRVIR